MESTYQTCEIPARKDLDIVGEDIANHPAIMEVLDKNLYGQVQFDELADHIMVDLGAPRRNRIGNLKSYFRGNPKIKELVITYNRVLKELHPEIADQIQKATDKDGILDQIQLERNYDIIDSTLGAIARKTAII